MRDLPGSRWLGELLWSLIPNGRCVSTLSTETEGLVPRVPSGPWTSSPRGSTGGDPARKPGHPLPEGPPVVTLAVNPDRPTRNPPRRGPPLQPYLSVFVIRLWGAVVKEKLCTVNPPNISEGLCPFVGADFRRGRSSVKSFQRPPGRWDSMRGGRKRLGHLTYMKIPGSCRGPCFVHEFLYIHFVTEDRLRRSRPTPGCLVLLRAEWTDPEPVPRLPVVPVVLVPRLVEQEVPPVTEERRGFRWGSVPTLRRARGLKYPVRDKRISRNLL